MTYLKVIRETIKEETCSCALARVLNGVNFFFFHDGFTCKAGDILSVFSLLQHFFKEGFHMNYSIYLLLSCLKQMKYTHVRKEHPALCTNTPFAD